MRGEDVVGESGHPQPPEQLLDPAPLDLVRVDRVDLRRREHAVLAASEARISFPFAGRDWPAPRSPIALVLLLRVWRRFRPAGQLRLRLFVAVLAFQLGLDAVVERLQVPSHLGNG